MIQFTKLSGKQSETEKTLIIKYSIWNLTITLEFGEPREISKRIVRNNVEKQKQNEDKGKKELTNIFSVDASISAKRNQNGAGPSEELCGWEIDLQEFLSRKIKIMDLLDQHRCKVSRENQVILHWKNQNHGLTYSI